ncbi:hypothetical protein BCR34DRAFT_567630 [Clohesyomyces aquaticus]|uniref:Alcohol acetyltransferase n=1 Tax=Clohesyomyces aquaticus TaxID=1231657 RepID=A0A1Y1ZID1_9PLEO|nr:hypothetical protein BCR34DRAFT_567630 [Clohesyomyces aquaticus]
MAVQQLKRIRQLGKLEEISAVAHDIDFFTNTGVSVHYEASRASSVFDLQNLIYVAVAEVLRLHPILFAIPVGFDTEEPYWARLPSIDLRKNISFVERSQPTTVDGEGKDRELDAILENQHNTKFSSEDGALPVWRLVIVKDAGVQHRFTASFIAHHAMSDGTGLTIFQKAFHKALDDTTTSCSPSQLELKAKPVILSSNSDPIAPSLEQLHSLPLPDTPPTQEPVTELKEWSGTPVAVPCKTRYTSLSIPAPRTTSFTKECKKNGVPLNAALPALIAKLLYLNLPPSTEVLTCNIPLSLRSDLPSEIVDGILGNFIDAFKVKLLRSELFVQGSSSNSSSPGTAKSDSDAPSFPSSSHESSAEIWPHAHKIQASTTLYYGHCSPTGEPYTNIAFFKNLPNLRPVLLSLLGTPRAESFEVSNLGTFTSPTNLKAKYGGGIWTAGKVVVSRCAYAAGAPLVITLVSSTEGMVWGFTWQEGAVGEEVVEGVVKGVGEFFGTGKAG